MGKGLPPPPSSDIETGRTYKSHRRTPPPPPPHFSPPAPKLWFAWLVPLVFVANIVMFVLTMYINDCPVKIGADKCLFYDYLGRFSFHPFKDNPLLGPSFSTLKELGALDWKLVVERKQAWRLISCIWLHAGVIHLVANMMSLLFIGIRLEQEFGFIRIGLLYVLSGFGGSLMSALASAGRKQTISVGASGALFGLLGAMLSELITNWTNYANKCAALLTLVSIISLNLAVGFLPHVDNSAHVGGFISGFLVGFVLLIRPQFGYVSRKHIPPGYEIKHKKPKHKCYQYLLWIIALVLLITGYAIGLTRLFKGQTFESKPLNSLD
ncbi:RHOMBOID-like protein 5 [Herrania umbratica]|uniref:RHOMBOID-like protein n=1 Tax=Herrania umbratica TaxID=108875 RepID=A0A6J1BGD3_9ROSI|nr:RHOMBOID-like protein 5 [Herrania umbratica]